LLKYDLTFDQVIDAIPVNNLNVGGGNIQQSGSAVLVHGIGRTVNEEQIRNIVINARDGVAIRVRDVAEVAVSHELRRGMVSYNGQGEVVLGIGFMLMGENSHQVTSRMREKFEQIRKSLPPGVRLEIAYDRTTLIE